MIVGFWCHRLHTGCLPLGRELPSSYALNAGRLVYTAEYTKWRMSSKQRKFAAYASGPSARAGDSLSTHNWSER